GRSAAGRSAHHRPGQRGHYGDARRPDSARTRHYRKCPEGNRDAAQSSEPHRWHSHRRDRENTHPGVAHRWHGDGHAGWYRPWNPHHSGQHHGAAKANWWMDEHDPRHAGPDARWWRAQQRSQKPPLRGRLLTAEDRVRNEATSPRTKSAELPGG